MSSVEPAPRRAKSPERTRPSFFWLLGAIIVPVGSWLAKIRIRGGEHLPMSGAYVIAPNHHTEIDPIFVAMSVWRLGRAPRFLIKDSVFKVPVVGAALRKSGMIPVSRGGSATAARETVAAATELVRAKRGVIVYAEGTLTRDPELWPMRAKTGAVRLAITAGIPLIPVAQWGAQAIMPRYGKIRLWPPRKPVDVVFGPPIDLSDLAGSEHDQRALQEGTDRMMRAITAMLGEIRGETPPEKPWNPAEHRQSETGRDGAEG